MYVCYFVCTKPQNSNRKLIVRANVSTSQEHLLDCFCWRCFTISIGFCVYIIKLKLLLLHFVCWCSGTVYPDIAMRFIPKWIRIYISINRMPLVLPISNMCIVYGLPGLYWFRCAGFCVYLCKIQNRIDFPYSFPCYVEIAFAEWARDERWTVDFGMISNLCLTSAHHIVNLHLYLSAQNSYAHCTHICMWFGIRSTLFFFFFVFFFFLFNSLVIRLLHTLTTLSL